MKDVDIVERFCAIFDEKGSCIYLYENIIKMFGKHYLHKYTENVYCVMLWLVLMFISLLEISFNVPPW